jgi:dienelactone hydrolase
VAQTRQIVHSERWRTPALKRALSDVKVHARRGETPVQLATAGDGPRPGIVVIHDALGMSTAVHNHADYWQARGYLALIPKRPRAARRAAHVAFSDRRPRRQLRGKSRMTPLRLAVNFSP